MKQKISLAVTLLLLCCFLVSPVQAAQKVEVNEDISVSGDYDWTKFSGDNITLNVYNWGLYISDGSDDSVNVLSAFENLTGIKVNYTTFDSNESLYAKMKSGGATYDVIVPSDYMVGKMSAEGMLAELDYANIPNFANIDDKYLGWAFDEKNAYSVPYMWGTTGIVYNKTLVDEAPDSWTDLWDVQYANNILMFNNSRDAYAIAAKILGYSMNPKTTAEVDTVMGQLKKQKNVVQAYVMDEIFDKMEGGEAAMAPYYAGDAITMIADNPDLAFVSPKEGVNFFVDSMCIPANSKNKEAAEMFINYMCEPDVGLANCEYIGYSTPMDAVRQMLPEELRDSPIAYPDDSVLQKAEVFNTLPDDVNAQMDLDWSEMKSYEQSGSGWLILLFLVVAIALAGFNIWRKLHKKLRDNY